MIEPRSESAIGEIDQLTRLAIKYGSDKWGPHFYTPIYHQLFSFLRDQPVRLLEIGVGGYELKTVGGASLAMWADYFPRGRIVGIDVAEKTLDLGPRITVRRGSQDDLGFLARLSKEDGPFDIILDDGSHIPKQVAASFNALFPNMIEGGLYVIEDVQTSFWPDFGGSVLDGGATMRLAFSILEHLNHAEIKIAQPTLKIAAFAKQIKSLRAYHNILVIEKGDNGEPSNFDYDLDNPHAARAIRVMEQELERAPTAEGFANLVNVYVLGRDRARAESLAREALGRWPDSPTMLAVAFDVTNDVRERLRIAERLEQIEPEWAGPLVERTKAELASFEARSSDFG